MPLLLCDLDDTLVSRRGFFAAWATTFLAEIGQPADDLRWFVAIDDDGDLPRPDFFQTVIDRYGLADTVEIRLEPLNDLP